MLEIIVGSFFCGVGIVVTVTILVKICVLFDLF